MKIDHKKTVNRCGYDQEECKELSVRLSQCSDEDLLDEIRKIKVWNYGKCELGLWTDVLDRLDAVLETAVFQTGQWTLRLDAPGQDKLVKDVVAILEFTGHLIEHSIYRYLYGSLDHILKLFCSSNMDILLAVLGLFYTFSKRSNYFNRVDNDVKKEVSDRLECLAETWGGKENGFGLAQCCGSDNLPPTASNVYFEYYQSDKEGEEGSSSASMSGSGNCLKVITLESLNKRGQSPTEVMEHLLQEYQVPKEKQAALFTRVRLATYFSDPDLRHKCLKARLQALSILCRDSRAKRIGYTFDVDDRNLYSGILEELMDVLQLSEHEYADIKASTLRTMTAIVHSGRLQMSWPILLEITGLSSYHGVLPNLVRKCIQGLVDGVVDASSGSVNQQYTTALLSFLYHLACYGESERGANQQRIGLLSSGVMDAMLQLIGCQFSRTDYLSFATRAVRVTDQILQNLASQQQTVISTLVGRLGFEVQLCTPSSGTNKAGDCVDDPGGGGGGSMSPMAIGSGVGGSTRGLNSQRAGLIKSILNLLKRLGQESEWIDALRNVMDNDLPGILRRVFLNPADFTPQLALFATQVITTYIYHIPSQISHMQDKGLTEEILHAFTMNPLPQSREFLFHMPQILNVLALNARGIESILESQVIPHLVNTLISPDYVSTMKQRRMRDCNGSCTGGAGGNQSGAGVTGNGTTASQMGLSMEELIRGHVQLRPALFTALIDMLRKVVVMGQEAGSDASINTSLVDLLSVASQLGPDSVPPLPSSSMEEGVSDDDEDSSCAPPGVGSTSSAVLHHHQGGAMATSSSLVGGSGAGVGRTGAKGDSNRQNLSVYLLNVCKFLESLLVTVNNYENHCRQFVNLDGAQVLCELIQIPALPLDFYTSQACQSINKIFYSLCNTAELADKVFTLLLDALKKKLSELTIFLDSNFPMHSVLLKDHLTHTGAPSAVVQTMVVTATLCFIIEQTVKNLKPEILASLMPKWSEYDITSRLGKLLLSVSWEAGVLLKLLCEDTDICREDLEQLALSGGGSEMTTASSCPADPSPSSSSQPSTSTTVSAATPVAVVGGGPVGDHQQQAQMQTLESLHIYALFKEDRKNKKNGPPSLSSFPDLEKVVHRLVQASTLVVKCSTDLTTGWMRVCAGGGSGSHSSIRPRRQGNQRTPGGPAARTSMEQLARMLTGFLTWQPPSVALEHPASPKLVYAMYYEAVNLTSALLFDPTRGPFGSMLQAFYAAGGVKHYFELFSKLFENNDIGEGVPVEKRCPSVLVLVLEEWLRCAERLSNVQLLLEERQRSTAIDDPRVPSLNVDKYLNTVRTHLYHPMSVLCTDTNVQLLLTQQAAEYMLSILQSVAPVVFNKTSSPSDSSSDTNTSTAATTGVGGEGAGATGNSASSARMAAATAVSNALSAAVGSLVGNHGLLDSRTATVQLLMEMGFQQSQVIDALEETDYNRDEAVNLLLTRLNDIPMEEDNMSFDDTNNSTSITSGARTSGHRWQSLPLPSASELPPPPPIVQYLRSGEVGTTEGGAAAGGGQEDRVKAAKEQLRKYTFQGCMAIARRHNTKNILNNIADIVLLTGDEDTFLSGLLSGTTSPTADATPMERGEDPVTDHTTLNILALMFTRTRVLSARLAHRYSLPSRLIQQMRQPSCIGPELTLCCLLLDQYERTTQAIELRREMIEAYRDRHQWLWFDDRSAVWQPYNQSAGKPMDTAFHGGELSSRYTTHQRPYTVHFPTMAQVNVESLNRRPVLLWPDLYLPSDTGVQGSPTKYEHEMMSAPPVPRLTPEERDDLIKILVSHFPRLINADTINSVLRLLLRLAYSDYGNASQLLDLGLIQQLFDFAYPKEFAGYPSFVGLLLRQSFEDPSLVRKSMEQVIRQLCERGVSCSYLGVSNSNPGCRDLFYLVGMFTPLYAKDRSLCLQLMQEVMEMDIDDKWVKDGTIPKNYVLKKDLSGSVKVDQTVYELNERQKALLNHLLDYIAQSSPSEPKPKDAPTNSKTKVISDTTKPKDTVADDKADVAGDSSTSKSAVETTAKLGKADCFKFLTEFILSYQSVAEYVARYRYPVTGESVLAYFLDTFLADSETGDLCTALFESIAQAKSDAQTILATELKMSINKIAMEPDAPVKNTKLTAHMKLIDRVVLLPNCSNLTRLMYKKQLPCDLAKLPALIDCNIPGSHSTITVIVKTLENLTRVERQVSKKHQQQLGGGASSSSAARRRHPAGLRAAVGLEGGAATDEEGGEDIPGDTEEHAGPEDEGSMAEEAPMETHEVRIALEATEEEEEDHDEGEIVMMHSGGSETSAMDDEMVIVMNQHDDEEGDDEEDRVDIDEDEDDDMADMDNSEDDGDGDDVGDHDDGVEQMERDDEDEESDESDDDEGSEGHAAEDSQVEQIVHHLNQVEMIEDDFDSFEYEEDDEQSRNVAGQLQVLSDTLSFSQLLNDTPLGAATPQIFQMSDRENLILHLPPHHNWDRPPAVLQDRTNLSTQHPVLQPTNARPSRRYPRDFLFVLRNQPLLGNLHGPNSATMGRTNYEALEGDMMVWELLNDEDSRSDTYPTNYRRWVELARLLYGRELMDMMLLARKEVYLVASTKREKKFAVAKFNLEAEKEKAAAAKVSLEQSKSKTAAVTTSGASAVTPVASTDVELAQAAITTTDILNAVESLQTSTTEAISVAPPAVAAPEEPAEAVAVMDSVSEPGATTPTPQGPTTMEQILTSPEEMEPPVSIPQQEPPLPAPAAPSTSTGGGATASAAAGGGSFEEMIAALIAEGIDPSFLEALPEDMRREVIADHMRARRVQEQLNTADLPSEINPEVLATLPPNIQEEVLAQYRQSSTSRIASPPPELNQPVDNISFLDSLPASLRREVLADMEESQLEALPQELAQEARQLRAENEQRYARFVQERLMARNIISGGRQPGEWRTLTGSRFESRVGHMMRVQPNLASVKGKQLVDHEGLTCILVLLITSSASTQRRPLITHLRKVLNNLSCHLPTRQWIVSTILGILRELKEPPSPTTPTTASTPPSSTAATSLLFSPPSVTTTGSCLIEVGFEAALGCRVRFLHPYRSPCGGKGEEHRLVIHPQAASLVCRVLLDTLGELARPFEALFYPLDEDKGITQDISTDFWEHVYQLSVQQPLLHSVNHLSTGVPPLPLTPGRKSSLPPSSSLLVQSPSSSLIEMTPAAGADQQQQQQLQLPPTPDAINYFSFLSDLVHHPVIYSRSEHLEKLLNILFNIITGFLRQRRGLTAANTRGGVQRRRDPDSMSRQQQRRWRVISSALEAGGGGQPQSDTEDNNAPDTPAAPPQEPSAAPVAAGSSDQPAPAAAVEEEEKDLMSAVSGPVVNSLIDLIVDKTANMKSRTLSTHVLTELSKANRDTKAYILELLKRGLLQLAGQLEHDLADMIAEIGALPVLAAVSSTTSASTSTAFAAANKADRGLLQDRFGAPGEFVVVVGNTKPRPIAFSELQLNSLEPFTATRSIQSRFLKVLTLMNQISDVSLEGLVTSLIELWELVSGGLDQLETTSDPNSVLLLQPLVEAFCLAHAHTHRPVTTGGASSGDQAGSSLQTSSTGGGTGNSSGGASGGSAVGEMSHLNLDLTGPASPGTVTQEKKSSTNMISSQKSEGNQIVRFAERHRTVLNQILRQQASSLTTSTSSGAGASTASAFSVLFEHPRVLDFDVKRRHFRGQLAASRSGLSAAVRDEELVVVTRGRIFEDSYTRLHRKTAAEWKRKFYITFQNEEGQDAGGLLREWYLEMSREIFDPNYCLFRTSPGDRVTYTINPSSYVNSNHLSYFKFVGRFIAKAIYDNKLLECYFTRSFYKHILGVPVKYTDLESEDYEFYKGLDFLLEHKVSDLGYDLSFSTEINEFGKTETRDLLENGRNVHVTEENKKEYVRLVCQERMTGAIRQQLNAFLDGFYDIIPKRLIAIFNEQELELLISGLPTIDIDDLKANTEYQKYQATGLQIQWFWRALRSFDQADRARFLQFVTGTSKVPLGGFANLEGMHGTQKFQIHRDSRSTDRLPTAHTCFNQLDLPAYETYEKLCERLLTAVTECSEGFGFA